MPGSASSLEPGLVVFQDDGAVNAIDEYTRRLVGALCEIGAPARYAPDGAQALSVPGQNAPWVLLQYNPLSYGRWGFAPTLLRRVLGLRRRTGGRIVLSVHEPWVDIYGWRSAVMSGYQRLQLRALLARADAIIAMTESLAQTLGRGAVPIPVGTNITPTTADTATARERFGLRDRFVVALFGRAHPSRALDYAERAIAELAMAPVGQRLTVFNLGDLAPRLALPAHVDVRTLSSQDDAELSYALRASDMLLLPFTDGVSTRRTTLMAGLAHGLPVVGLRAPESDRSLLTPGALILTPVGDRVAFARAVVSLSTDSGRLREIGEAGRRLYAERFAWPVIARMVRDVVMPPR